ncbi:FecCD family ABC transporter permease [Streptococcus dysgalactiae]|uniref:Probable heme-iron transport system permease protein IsdF n=2 Tax=Streptococcus dysgalactiae TaxID=1334 RepID=A0AB33RAE3_STREQ|nr:iron ABC transporter permease [Streptococcus dysgalactiae]ADX25272.1 Ferrichrome transport system permease protein fhuB [Streptococcus dysgalactiae subsp. equisimilis ATCC 12394]MDQ0262014.1 iron complex transport system permease protein [Streptococcus dysgalactiae]OBZ04242.1 ABC transporter permease [Streptococcus dysgalactiae subsp. equisimilis]QET83078.1 iron ABC transporter permease [Streptococcus dysgalactiae]QJD62539.1 iron ABC transporter permease [Streptococcus dysgalactiae subsp. e
MATLDLQQDLAFHAKKRLKRTIYVIMLCLALLILSAVALSLGGLSVSYGAIVKGLFVAYDPQVALIYDLRFPRIVIALLAGAGIAVSGVLFQAVLKNPISDPAIIGVCSGASFMVLLSSLLLPQLLLYGPILSFLGGGVSFLLIYGLAWKKGLHPVRIILTGIAINALFMGLSTALPSFSASASPLVNALLAGQISQKTWVDVGVLLPYTLIGLGLALLFSRICDLLLLDDQVIRNLGMDSHLLRLGISLIAVLLASAATSVVGVVSFLGLIVPHISRLLVGSKHQVLIPFSALLGAFVFLLADTLGRRLAYPLEISPAIIMSIIGGPYFIYLLRRSDVI